MHCELAFERQRDGLRRRLRQPVELCSYRRNLALQTPRYTNAQLAAEIEKVTLPQVRGLQARLLPEVELEPSVAGNVAAGQATALVAELQAALGSKPVSVSLSTHKNVCGIQ